MENKKLNIILIAITIGILLIITYMIYLIIRTENSRIYFSLNDIQNIKWINEEENVSFLIENNNATLDILGERIINGLKIEFDPTTGEITYMNNGEEIKEMLYVRSVNEDYLILWYDKAEYRLTKEIINK